MIGLLLPLMLANEMVGDTTRPSLDVAHVIPVADTAKPARPAMSYVEQLVERARQSLAAAGNDRDPVLAASILAEAAKAGSTEALLLLADRYRLGDGESKDLARAQELIQAAIAAGNVQGGELSLGDFYRLADPPFRDLGKAADAYQRAADAGNTWSMIQLADMLRSGTGVPVDYGRARTLLEAAIAAGDVKK